MSAANADPNYNPYLAHMYGNGGVSLDGGSVDESSASESSLLDKFKRHATRSAQAAKAEDGPNNPFNGRPLSQRYMTILKTRRNLPVHTQR